MSVVIPSAGSIGTLFAIPEADWVSINDRVGLVIDAQNLASEIEQIIPNYAALLTACELWRPTTFPGLIAQAAYTSAFAAQAAETLGDLAGALKSLQPEDPLPVAVKFIFTVHFAALRDTAAEHSTTLDEIATQTSTFVAENRATDAVLQNIIDRLGPGWQDVAGPIGSLESAMSDVQTGWSSIQADFAAAANPPPDLTTAAVLAADVGGAITSWNTVGEEAVRFDSMATNLTTAPV